MEKAVEWLMRECEISAEVAVVAINHCRGNVLMAREVLSNNLLKKLFEREVREYS